MWNNSIAKTIITVIIVAAIVAFAVFLLMRVVLAITFK